MHRLAAGSHSATHVNSLPCSSPWLPTVKKRLLRSTGACPPAGCTADKHWWCAKHYLRAPAAPAAAAAAMGSRQPALQESTKSSISSSPLGLLPVQAFDSSITCGAGITVLKNLGPGVSVVASAPCGTANSNDNRKQHAEHDIMTGYSGVVLNLDSNSEPSHEVVVNLGEVCASAFLAVARIKLCWMAPYHSCNIAALPGHIQFMLMEVAPGGPYSAVLPLLPDDCKATLQPARDQNSSGNLLAVHLASGNIGIRKQKWQHAVYIAAGWDPYELIDAAVTTAAAITGTAKPRWEKQAPDITRYLGWCTWDAFYHDVSAKGIVSGLESFRTSGVEPRWLIIDDGWQRTGLDGAPHKQQQLSGEQVKQHGQAAVSSITARQSRTTSDGSGNSSSGRSWLAQPWHNALAAVQQLVLHALTAVSDRLTWWSMLLAAIKSPLSGVVVWLLKRYNVATSEHSKRLLSNEMNAKFSNLNIGTAADTSSTAAPSEVAAVLAAIKQEFNIKRIYAWHALLGYWSGTSPAATAAAPATAVVATAAAMDAVAAIKSTPAHDIESEVTVAAKAAASAAIEGNPSANDAGSVATGNKASGKSGSGGGSSTTSNGITCNNGNICSNIVLPEVTAAMSDLEPPCNWSQLVLAGLGLPSDPVTFYNQLHDYLAALGIDGVKVDVQNQMELAGAAAGQSGGQALAEAFHSALEGSVARHFPGNHMINCMCHNTSNLYRMCDTMLARCSDDFYPRLPASHATHVAVCAYNSLFMGPLLMPDWDMFHSKHPRGLLHATARMISGGPVYVSDKPNHHDPTLLARLALPGGLLVQPLLPGRPTRDCLFVDPCKDGVSLLKVWNRNSCGGVVAAFNLQGSSWSRDRFKFVTHDLNPPVLSATVTPTDVEGLSNSSSSGDSNSNGSKNPKIRDKDVNSSGRKVIVSSSGSNGSNGSAKHSSSVSSNTAPAAADAKQMLAGVNLNTRLQYSGSYVLYCDSTKSLTVVEGAKQGVTVTLPAAGSEIVTVAPVLQFKQQQQQHGDHGNDSNNKTVKLKFAVVGLVNMLNPGGAVKHIAAVSGSSRIGSSNGSASHGKSSSAGGSSRSSGGGSSDSWVVADGEVLEGQAAFASFAAGAASTAGASDSAPDQTAFSAQIQVLGQGRLLVYCSHSPAQVLLRGVNIGFEYDSRSSELMLQIPDICRDYQAGTEDVKQNTVLLKF